MSAGYHTQNELLLQNLLTFYDDKNLEKMLKIINGESKISLRIVDWFTTNYAKKHYTVYENNDNIESSKRFKVYNDYKLKLKAYSKKRFDPFCRWERITIPYQDNKFSALNTAVWSGGSFIYVPKGIKVEMPVQAYFRINAKNMGQFERTLIIADEGSSIHYVEGCTAPTYSTDSLHSAVVELIALDGAHIRYSTIQNWSANVYNLVTKRGIAHEDASIEWIDGNIGSKLTMKYPSVILKGEGSHAEVISIAYAGKGQHQDAGAKVHHLASNTTSKILSKIGRAHV